MLYCFFIFSGGLVWRSVLNAVFIVCMWETTSEIAPNNKHCPPLCTISPKSAVHACVFSFSLTIQLLLLGWIKSATC